MADLTHISTQDERARDDAAMRAIRRNITRNLGQAIPPADDQRSKRPMDDTRTAQIDPATMTAAQLQNLADAARRRESSDGQTSSIDTVQQPIPTTDASGAALNVNATSIYEGEADARRQDMTFSGALAAIKAGERVARFGWNGKAMFLFLVPGSTFEVNREPLLSIMGKGTMVDYQPHIDMRTASGTIVPWLASQSDLLAGDWCVLDVPIFTDASTGKTTTHEDAAA